MLSGCAAGLVARGWHVVLPSRRYSPLPTDSTPPDARVLTGSVPSQQTADEHKPGAAARESMPANGKRPTGGGRALWVEANWSDPQRLAEQAGKALGGPADLLVEWVHSEFRGRVLDAVAPLLAADARVVEVHGSSADDPSDALVGPYFDTHPTQQVVLGFTRQGNTTRWLTHAEISDGVCAAVRRALQGLPPSVHQVGETRPWALHP